MNIPRAGLLVVGLYLAAPLGLIAQVERGVQTGARVRATAPGVSARPLVGTLVAMSADSWTLDAAGADSALVVPLDSVTGLEVSQGRKSRALRGALLGFVAGFVGGYAYENAQPPKDIDTRGLVGIIVGAPCALVGGVIGSHVVVDSWEPVTLDAARIGTSVTTLSGVRIGVSLRLW